MREKRFLAGWLVIMLIFGMSASGCSTTQHGVAISNVSANNISEVYIRDAGRTNWGSNLARNLQNIDRSKFSQTVDIRVVDTNGIVYSKFNVPFDDAAFVETSKTKTINSAAGILMLLSILSLAIALSPVE